MWGVWVRREDHGEMDRGGIAGVPVRIGNGGGGIGYSDAGQTVRKEERPHVGFPEE